MANEHEEIRTHLDEVETTFGSGREMILKALLLLYSLYLSLLSDKGRLKMLAKLYKEAGYKSQKNTDASTKVVRLSIVSDRRKASPYAKVLRSAAKAKVAPNDFINWVNERGGIEAIRLSKEPLPEEEDPKSKDAYEEAKKAAQLRAQKVLDFGKEHLATKPAQATVTLENDVDVAGNVAVLIVSRRVDEIGGDWNVVEVLNETAADAKAIFRRNAAEAKKRKSGKANTVQSSCLTA